jgi:hypothetical protein
MIPVVTISKLNWTHISIVYLLTLQQLKTFVESMKLWNLIVMD